MLSVKENNQINAVVASYRDNIYNAQRGKKALMPYANSEGPDERAHPCSLILTFSFNQHILQCIMIL